MPYRPRFHVAPPQGRLNDPNGLYLDGTTLHAFYQHDPAFPRRPKRIGWGHASADLRSLRWQHHPDALTPDTPYDRHGCYSGCAVRTEDGLRLYYTGNLKTEDGTRVPSQNLVHVHHPAGPEGGFYQRSPLNPLIPREHPGYTGHFRDPHITPITAEEAGDGGSAEQATARPRWRMLLGAQREEERGAVVVYESADLESWDWAGELRVEPAEAAPQDAFMWECPNLVPLRDEVTGERLHVLFLCPQRAGGDESGYIVGRLEGHTFHALRPYQRTDWGFEFYAPQAALDGDTALLLGWAGMPAQDESATLAAEGWVHTLTLPRRLSLHNHALRQRILLPDAPEQLPADEAYGPWQVWRRSLLDEAWSVEIEPGFSLTWSDGQLELRRGEETRLIPVAGGAESERPDNASQELNKNSIVLIIRDGNVVDIEVADGRFCATSHIF
ncbi:glycoside hydrolase family 32 protein [Corynebacterium uropygiale]|uniref:beta-fructofuranosidase n=1 Tax=Corynebacterium uropygiale TaxID=1775911 RepID=A0A9X1QPQ3_9CORY|nr:glycoside hydrolase family 32 protein [Corynebacterium uropygiale]MCF4005573.1 glycoside hydrolase family 32 protein [Corynebacterium uropygiale]